MFGKKEKEIEYRCETTNFDKVRDFMEYAARSGYKCNYENKYAAGMHYYEVTIKLSQFQAELLATTAIYTEATEFHANRNKERNAIIEDAKRDGYSQAVNDQAEAERKAKATKTKNE